MNEARDAQHETQTDSGVKQKPEVGLEDHQPEVSIEAIQDLDPGADADFVTGGHPCQKSQLD